MTEHVEKSDAVKLGFIAVAAVLMLFVVYSLVSTTRIISVPHFIALAAFSFVMANLIALCALIELKQATNDYVFLLGLNACFFWWFSIIYIFTFFMKDAEFVNTVVWHSYLWGVLFAAMGIKTFLNAEPGCGVVAVCSALYILFAGLFLQTGSGAWLLLVYMASAMACGFSLLIVFDARIDTQIVHLFGGHPKTAT